jgi:predicted O-linked N-acetylglucosamine transferase (SPINDLY family)
MMKGGHGLPFFMLFPQLTAWPDRLAASQAVQQKTASLNAAAIRIRCGDFSYAETALLTLLDQEPLAALRLLTHLRLLQGQYAAAEHLLARLPAPLNLFDRYLQAQLWLQTGRHQMLLKVPASFWLGEDDEPLLALAHAALALNCGECDLGAALLARPALQDCPEQLRLKARVLKGQGQTSAALQLLREAALRAPQLLGLQQHLIDELVVANRYPEALAELRRVLHVCGEHVSLLAQVATLKLLQRQPGLARRAALLHRLKSKGVSDQQSITNQLITYEQTGHSDWLAYLNASLLGEQADPNLLANLVMQLASVESSKAKVIAGRFCDLMDRRNHQIGITTMPNTFRGPALCDRVLRVVWLSGDICDHPVGRFLLGFFQASQDCLRHRHTIVSWSESERNPFHGYFQQINGVEFVNVEGVPAGMLVEKIRAFKADIVVDLAGWTAKNFGNGLLARLAPVQVNYLGYFASTGNPSIDVWLGDHQLFPEPMREWHSESILRLPRCFIAWQPPAHLPEAQVPVPSAPMGPVRFGSFNHNRKFSDCTLTLWGQMLSLIPGARLVLKATASGDEATLELLTRRMQRCGLDQQRVIWLPLVADSRDHLMQYGHIDVALDCLPNGGCTTTCEALWMGVPVITLSGNTYVSRMSTAVLHGAGLGDWCAASEAEYLALAVRQARRVDQLRTQRLQWRQQLQRSPLGDAADLMRHLEHAFSLMVAQHASTHEPAQRG